MRDLIHIDAAIRVLGLFRAQRLTTERREKVNLAIADLQRAQVDPEYRKWLHMPRRMRNILENAE